MSSFVHNLYVPRLLLAHSGDEPVINPITIDRPSSLTSCTGPPLSPRHTRMTGKQMNETDKVYFLAFERFYQAHLLPIFFFGRMYEKIKTEEREASKSRCLAQTFVLTHVRFMAHIICVLFEAQCSYLHISSSVTSETYANLRYLDFFGLFSR